MSARNKRILRLVIYIVIFIIGATGIFNKLLNPPEDQAPEEVVEGTLIVSGNEQEDLPVISQEPSVSVEVSDEPAGSAGGEAVSEAQPPVSETVPESSEELSVPVPEIPEDPQWADFVTTEDLKFRNKSLRDSHYEKHGIEMGFATVEDYVAAANAVIQNPDALHKQEKEDNDDIYFLESTNEFVVVSTDGYIRTYYICSGKKYFDRQ